MKTQHVKCLSVRELYNLAISGQPINSHFHKLFDAPDCDLDDESVIMSPDCDDFIEIAQARADIELEKIVNRENSNVKKEHVDLHENPVTPGLVGTPQSIDIEEVSQNVNT